MLLDLAIGFVLGVVATLVIVTGREASHHSNMAKVIREDYL